MNFRIGVNYWPARSAVAMWREFDAGEIGADFAHMAALGLDTVRFFIRWDDFAPRAGALDPVMLDRLEALLDRAADAKLTAIPTLLCGHMYGVNWLPGWALDRSRPRGRYRTFSGETESPYGAATLYSGALLDAQTAFARAVAERVRDHPALYAWDIGADFSNVDEPAAGKVVSGEHAAEPVAEPVVADWSRRLSAAVREASPLPVTAGTHSGDLTRDRSVRLASLCAPFAFASMRGSNVTSAFARNRLDPEVLPFLAMLTAAFSFKPVLVSAFGNPACPGEKFSAFERFAEPGEPPAMTISPDDTAFATYPCLTDRENAAFCASVLERLHADGRLGALWSSWSDYPDAWADRPPFDHAPHERFGGIVRADGSEKPVAAALSAFAARRLDVVPANDMPMISSTYYYRTLPASTKTLYDAFLGFIAERRGNVTSSPAP